MTRTTAKKDATGVREKKLTPEEAAAEFAVDPEAAPAAPEESEDEDEEAEKKEGDEEDDEAEPPQPGNVEDSELPDWAVIPNTLKVPPGVEIAAMRFRAPWTRAPHKGDRVCIAWTLSDYEEIEAYKRARGDNQRAAIELAKATIRVVDGMAVDRGGGVGPNSLKKFWNEIGPKCRKAVVNNYVRTHQLGKMETLDFLVNCYVVARSQPT